MVKHEFMRHSATTTNNLSVMSHTATCHVDPHHSHASEGLGGRARQGLRAVGLSLGVLGLTAFAQVVVYLASGSVALLADLIHNVGDALTALPIGLAFLLRSERAERFSGYGVVGAIAVSALVAGVTAVGKLLHPTSPDHLLALAEGAWADRIVRTAPRSHFLLDNGT